MLMSLIVIVLVGAIAYFHYVEGFFSSTLSAILAIIAAVVALSYHEAIVVALLKGKFADQAHALVLVALFAGVYTILRIIFDKAIPGNLRLPVLLDKLGAAAMGAVAGCCAVGIFAIAAQLLPFGPSIAGYTRYETVGETTLTIPGARRSVDSAMYNTLKSDGFDPVTASGLILPVDDIVVGLTRKLSDGGSLAGPVSFSSVHPDLLNELFGQRLGIQTGAKHVALNVGADRQVSVSAVYTLDSIAQADGEIKEIKPRWSDGLKPELKSGPLDINVIIRLNISRNATDADNNVRISTGAVRLAYNGKNYYPVGTIQHEGGPIVRANRPDDFLILPGDSAADFVFHLPREEFGIEGGARAATAEITLPPGAFIEAKRLGFVDLSGRKIDRTMPEAPKGGIIRKKDLPLPTGPVGSRGTAAQEASGGPINFGRLLVADRMNYEINVGTADKDGDINFGSGNGRLREGKFLRLEVDTTKSIRLLAQGDWPVSTFWVPGGQKLVQIVAAVPSKTDNPWEWADKLGQFELLDSNQQHYKPHGAWALVKQSNSDRLVARYNAESPVNDIPSAAEVRPVDVWIAFLVPDNTVIRELRFAGKRIKSLDETVR